MSLLKGNMNAGGLFTAQDDVRGLSLIAPGTVPSYLALETADGVTWYLFINDSDEWIMHTSAPTAGTAGVGNIITGAGNSGANKTLSNLGTVVCNTSIQSDTTLTDDMGDASYYWKSLYARDLYLNSTATMKGTSAGQIDVVGNMEMGVDGTGIDVKFYADSTGSYMLWDMSEDHLLFTDSTYLKFGDSSDIIMDWDGTDFNIDGSTDDYVVRFGEAKDLDIIFEGYSSSYDCGWVADSKTFQLMDTAILRLGGSAIDTLTDGVALAFDGSDTLNIDAYTANDAVRFGETTITDVQFDGASGYDVLWDGSDNEMLFNDNAKLVFGGTADDAVFYSDGTLLQIELNGGTTAGINMAAYASQTTAVLNIDGTANGWKGADNVGMLTISNDVAAAHAGATLLMLSSTGTPIAAAEGFVARFVDTGARTNATWAVQMDSTDNAVCRMVTGSTQDEVLVIQGGASGVASLVTINGATNTWDGADNVGMLHLHNAQAMAHAGATLLYIGSTGTPIASAQGVCMRVEETGGRTASAYAVEIDSLDNRCLNLVSGSTTAGDYVLNVTGGTSSIGALVNIAGTSNTWVGADDVGMLNLYCADASFANAGATMLRVASSGQPISAAEGFLARFVDTGTARTNAYAVDIEVTTTTGALHCNGHATFDRGLQCGAVAITASGAGNSVCPDGVSHFTVTSVGSTSIVTLPTPTPGSVVWMYGTGGTGFEVRSDTPASVAINGGTGASAETPIADSVLTRFVCTSATTWVATHFSTVGTESAAAAAA